MKGSGCLYRMAASPPFMAEVAEALLSRPDVTVVHIVLGTASTI